MDNTPEEEEHSLSPKILQQFNNISFHETQPHAAPFNFSDFQFNELVADGNRSETNNAISNAQHLNPSRSRSMLQSDVADISHAQPPRSSASPSSSSSSSSVCRSSSSNQSLANQENTNPDAAPSASHHQFDKVSNQHQSSTHTQDTSTEQTKHDQARNQSPDKQTARTVAGTSTSSPEAESKAVAETKVKSSWKEQYNLQIREGKKSEKAGEFLCALKCYLKAQSIAPPRKENPKLNDRIKQIKDKCCSHELDQEEDAFELIDNSRWYRNICTDNVHMLADPKSADEEDEEEEEETEDDQMEYILPGDIYDQLYPYQRDCLVWFWKIFQSQNGGILGDDMGLGKTVQMTAFLHGLFYSGLIRCVLLIVPVSVMSHWMKEINKWCFEGVKILKYHASVSKKRRSENLQRIAKRGGILVTTYGMVQKNFAEMDIQQYTKKRDRANPNKIIQRKWDYMVLDEGHKIKNHLIGTSKAVRQIPVENSNKVILSGTFLQNELSELWSLFDFISEGKLFGSYRAFNSEFACKINAGRLKNASRVQKQLSVKLTEIIKKTIAPFLLQRTKQEIRQKQEEEKTKQPPSGTNPGRKGRLTPVLQCQKRELVIWIKLNEVQTELYRTFLESEVVKETLNTTKSPLAALTVLKKICDHPFLLSDKMVNCQQLTQLTEITKDKSIRNTLATSNKMYVLMELLAKLIENKHRILVFSQSKVILTMIETILKEHKICYIRMDGDTDIEKRQQYVDAFNKLEKIKIFLLSTRVGGLGLNLVGSDRVIIYDPAWNPAIDAQAVDRSYRIGQTRHVMVYRFVTCGTIEEKIYRRQISKVGLLKSMTGNSNQARYFSKKELKQVFTFENPNMSQTQQQFKQLHEHRIGTNAEFDLESSTVECIGHVYGITHHDLLFKTCPTEELDENPELAQEIEQARNKLFAATVATPRTRGTRRSNKTASTARKPPNTVQRKIEEFFNTPRVPRKLSDQEREQQIRDLQRIQRKDSIVDEEEEELVRKLEPFSFQFDSAQKNNNDHNKNKKHAFANPLGPMDEEEENDSEADSLQASTNKNVKKNHNENYFAAENSNNYSFISNISAIEPKEASVSQSIPESITNTKKTRQLRKRQNRFIADSDTEDEEQTQQEQQQDNSRRFLNEKNRCDYISSSVRKPSNESQSRINKNILFQTPILKSFNFNTSNNALRRVPYTDNNANTNNKNIRSDAKNEDNAGTIAKKLGIMNRSILDDDEIDVTDIAKVIRSQPRRKRKQSIANLQQLMAADTEDEEEEANDNLNTNQPENDDDEQDSDATVSDDDQTDSIQRSSNIPAPSTNIHEIASALTKSAPSQPSSDPFDFKFNFDFNKNVESGRPQHNNSDANLSPSALQSQSHAHSADNSSTFKSERNTSWQRNDGQEHNSSFANQSNSNDNTSAPSPFRAPPSKHLSFLEAESGSSPSYPLASASKSSASFHHSYLENTSSVQRLQQTNDSKLNTNNKNLTQNASSSRDAGQSFHPLPSSNNTSFHRQDLSNYDDNNNRSSFHNDATQKNAENSFSSVSQSQSALNNNSSTSLSMTNVSNPYLDENLMNQMDSFSPAQNQQFVESHHTHSEDTQPTVQIEWNFKVSPNQQSCAETNTFAVDNNYIASQPAADYDDEETESEDEVMTDKSRSKSPQKAPVFSDPQMPKVDATTKEQGTERQEQNTNSRAPSAPSKVTLETIFHDVDELEKRASVEQAQRSASLPAFASKNENASVQQKRKRLSSTFRRYRRKSIIPQIEDYDDFNDEEEDAQPTEDETEHVTEADDRGNKENYDSNSKPEEAVCEEHRSRNKKIGYDCTKCECYLSEAQKLEYQRLIEKADECETRGNLCEALQTFMDALSMCNQDFSVHEKCNLIAQQLGFV